jgi:hypothetical protein
MKTDRRTEEDTREGTLAKRRLLGVSSGTVAADGAARGAAPGRSSRIATINARGSLAPSPLYVNKRV